MRSTTEHVHVHASASVVTRYPPSGTSTTCSDLDGPTRSFGKVVTISSLCLDVSVTCSRDDDSLPLTHTDMRTLPFSVLALCVVACSDDSTAPAAAITYPLKAVDAAPTT